jgi:hypothetical protein
VPVWGAKRTGAARAARRAGRATSCAAAGSAHFELAGTLPEALELRHPVLVVHRHHHGLLHPVRHHLRRWQQPGGVGWLLGGGQRVGRGAEPQKKLGAARVGRAAAARGRQPARPTRPMNSLPPILLCYCLPCSAAPGCATSEVGQRAWPGCAGRRAPRWRKARDRGALCRCGRGGRGGGVARERDVRRRRREQASGRASWGLRRVRDGGGLLPALADDGAVRQLLPS